MLTFWPAAAALAAQPATATPQQQTSPKTPEKITISGCVERADQMTSAGASTLGTTGDSLSFVLVDGPSRTPRTSGGKGDKSPAPEKRERPDAHAPETETPPGAQ